MPSLSPQHLKKTAAAIGAALICILAIGILQKPQLEKLVNRSTLLSKEEIEQELEIEKLRLRVLKQMPAFGFDNLIADWNFLNFLQYFGDEPARLQTTYDLSADYLEVSIERDPRFLDAYLFLSIASSMYAATPERSVEILEKGLKSLPIASSPELYGCISSVKIVDKLVAWGLTPASQQHADRLPGCDLKRILPEKRANEQFGGYQTLLSQWVAPSAYYAWDYRGEIPKYYYVWRYQGIDQFLFLGEAQLGQQSFEVAAQRAELYAALHDDPVSEAAARSSRATARFIAANPDSKLARISAWLLVLNTAFDDKTREIVLQRLQELGAEISVSANGQLLVKPPPE